MTNILNELWDGEIHPQDSLIDGNEYYKDLQHLLSRNQADLARTLSDEQKDLFEKYCDTLSEMNSISEKAAFSAGVRFAMRLAAETLSGK